MINRITKKLIKEIEKEAQKFFKNASGCHDWTHVKRVKNLALNIGKVEKADLAVLEIAVLLHDIGRKEEIRKKGIFCHAEKGAELARKILEKHKLDKKIIDDIAQCIISHRYRNEHIPEIIEAKVLYDADKLDSIGAIGLARAFLFAGGPGSNTLYTGNEKKLAKRKKDYSYTKEDSAILEYEVKLKNIKNRMITKTGKQSARERAQFMREFVKRFWREVGGKA
tara:strand:- start:214 stop:885 length:672 start_codon:yes stop_codon:yes gene_type:complete